LKPLLTTKRCPLFGLKGFKNADSAYMAMQPKALHSFFPQFFDQYD